MNQTDVTLILNFLNMRTLAGLAGTFRPALRPTTLAYQYVPHSSRSGIPTLEIQLTSTGWSILQDDNTVTSGSTFDELIEAFYTAVMGS